MAPLPYSVVILQKEGKIKEIYLQVMVKRST